MKSRNKRLIFVLLGLFSVGGASALVSKAMEGNLNYLYTPEQVLSGESPKNTIFRLGGLVKIGSLERSKTKLETRFIVVDNRNNEITVVTDKILPDLFQEGKGQVSRGKMNEKGLFIAEEVLAKHDSEYMPAELKDILDTEHSPAKENLATKNTPIAPL